MTADGKEPNNLAFVSDVNSAVTSNLEEFFTKVLAISPTANDSEIQTLRSDLSQYFTAEASASTLYSFLTGGSSAKELGEKTVKIGSPTVTLASSESSDSRRYLVVVPFAALNSEKIYNLQQQISPWFQRQVITRSQILSTLVTVTVFILKYRISCTNLKRKLITLKLLHQFRRKQNLRRLSILRKRRNKLLVSRDSITI